MNKNFPYYRRTALSLVLAFGCSATAQALWLNTYDSTKLDAGFSFQAPQGGIYQALAVGGASSGYSSLGLINNAGTPKWQRKIKTGGIDSLLPIPMANGQFLINGTTKATKTAKPKAVWSINKVNARTGNLTPLFSKTFKGSVASFLAYEEPASKKLLGLGQIKRKGDATDMMVTLINKKTGDAIWKRIFHNNTIDLVTQIFPNGRKYVLVAETASASSAIDQKVVVGLLNAQGRPVAGTFKKYGADNAINVGFLTPIKNGNFLLVGTTTSSSGLPNIPGIPGTSTASMFVIKLNANLNVVWKKTIEASANASLSSGSAVETKDGSYVINANFTPAFSLTDPLASFEQHPVAIKLSSTGNLLDDKLFDFGGLDSGSFRYVNQNGNESFLFTGTTSTVDFQNQNQDSSGIFGQFNKQLQPDWLNTIDGADYFSPTNLYPTDNGYLLSGSYGQIQTLNTDILTALLNVNGTIPGCQPIKPFSVAISDANLSVKNLGWNPTATALTNKSSASLVVQDLPTLVDTKLPKPTVSSLCN